MNERKISEEKFSDTGYSYTLSLISGKYKPIVLYCLMEYEPVRFNEMRRYLGSAADKTLSQTLKELERDGLINRKMYPEIPPKVEYTLTERGHSLMKVLDQLCTWGTENRPVE
jgi:DNA-binding HxlR family transcriptional regulator